MIKIFCLTICLLFSGLIASCEKAAYESGPEPSDENILRIDLFGAISSLNPIDERLGSSSDILPLLYSFLCVPDETGRLQPDLALSWTYDPEKFIWTIILRDNAVFHDNQPVTLKDAAFSLLYGLQIEASLMESIQDIAPVSDTKLYIYLKKDDPDFMKKIWSLWIFPHPVDGSANEHEHANYPVGSGPFQFVSKTGNEKVVLKANKKYYNSPPLLDGVDLYYEPDRETSWARLLSGKTDIAFEISPKNLHIMQQYEDEFYFDHYAMHRYSIVLYNTHDPLFSNPKVRQALTHAIDRNYIVDKMLNGYGKVACGPMGIDSPYHNPEVVPLPYDPEKSLDLLFQAGWTFGSKGRYLYKDNKLFKFTLFVIKEFPVEQAIARYIKLCFNDIGIQMTINLIPLVQIGEKFQCQTNFQAVLTELSDGYRCPEWLKEFWSPCSCRKSVAGCFSHLKVTKLLEQAFMQTDPAEKIKTLHQADALITSLQPGTFLYHKTAIDVMSKRFVLPTPFELTLQGIYRLKDAVLRKKINPVSSLR